jgi:bacillithiol system protein YtxJ
MDWIKLDSEKNIEEIKKESEDKPQVIFKHSSRCSISATALSRLERSWNKEEMGDIKYYFLDLIPKRALSQMVADIFHTTHESPQVLIIYQGRCIYNASHMGISYSAIKNAVTDWLVRN